MASVLIRFDCAPGDIVAITAAIRDLATLNPGLHIYVDTNHPEVFWHNPHLSRQPRPDRFDRVLDVDYLPGVRLSNSGHKLHFITYFHELFRKSFNLICDPLKPYPDLHLSEWAKEHSPIDAPYWLMFAGGKPDITIKHWGYARYQAVVYGLASVGINVVQTGAAGHMHQPLNNVLNLVGWGGLREMFWQIYHAQGVICPITCGMHVAAAFQKPCVVIAGSREEPWWEAYNNKYQVFNGHQVDVPHDFIDRIGYLDCCRTVGCWNQKLQVGAPGDRLCSKVVNIPGMEPVAACMDLISPEEVVYAVLSHGIPHTTTNPKVQSPPFRLSSLADATETGPPLHLRDQFMQNARLNPESTWKSPHQGPVRVATLAD